MSVYIAAEPWSQESQRLRALEKALDPQSRRLLERLGLGAGVACLEIGPGLGSIARWMSERVGPDGRVLALDLDTRPFQTGEREAPNLELRTGDIEAEVPPGSFDVVHARLVLGHVRNKAAALRHVFQAVRPGGRVLIEDADFLWTELGVQPLHPEPDQAPCFTVWQAAARFMAQAGFDVHWGRNLARAMRMTGFDDVHGEATALVGDSDLTTAMRLTMARFAPALSAAGVPWSALTRFDEVMASPDVIFTGNFIFSVSARRPENDEAPGGAGRAEPSRSALPSK